MLELRHIFSPLVGYDIFYSFRGTIEFCKCVNSACPLTVPNGHPKSMPAT